MRNKGKVIIDFDYMGRSYSYDLMEETSISDVIDQDRRDVIADIAFISAVVLDYVKRKNSILLQMDQICKDQTSVSYVRDKVSLTSGKTPDKVSQSAINENLVLIPKYKALKDELSKIEEKLSELENMKWSLIHKKDMLSVIRQ